MFYIEKENIKYAIFIYYLVRKGELIKIIEFKCNINTILLLNKIKYLHDRKLKIFTKYSLSIYARNIKSDIQ